jgi:DNA-3-methyladenine glycosylase I
MTQSKRTRCAWCGVDPLYVDYHDKEWGVPVYDSRELWETLILEGFQAGLSWITVLRKRENFRKAFAAFNPEKIARYGARDVARLLADPGIIRSKTKILATIGNAQAYLAMRDQGGDFSDWVWDFAKGVPLQGNRKQGSDIPASTPLSVELSKALKSKGLKFVGPSIVYAWLQAVGVVNDHVATCFRHAELNRPTRRARRK